MPKLYIILGFAVAFTLALVPSKLSAQTTCPSVPSNTGSVTFSTTIPADGTYKIWTRMRPNSSDVNANSFFLQIGNQCAVKVGDNTAALPVNTWTWVDFRDGDTTQKTIFALSQGSQTLKIIGNEANVHVDKILLITGDDPCIPLNEGNNCTIAATPTLTPTSQPPTLTPLPTGIPTSTPPVSNDTIKPTVSITNPLNGAVVSRRSTVSITALASDNVAIDHVTFSVGGNTSTDYTAPYSYSWSVSGKPNSSYTITTTAYDTSNNTATQTIRVTSNK